MTKSVLQAVFSLVLLLSPFCINAQGTDSPCDAVTLGFLPGAPPCAPGGVSFGPAVNQTGNNLGALNDTITGVISSCYAGPPLHDVWYKFTASETHLEMTIQGVGAPALDSVYIGLYESVTGECIVMVPRQCYSRDGIGPHTVEFGPLTFGVTYYLQVSSRSYTGDGSFTFTLRSKKKCGDCAKNSILTAFPPPAEAAYPPDTLIGFCYSIAGFDEQNGNRLHGVVPLFGSGWDATSLTIVDAADSADFAGQWKWFPNININGSTVSGFFYDVGGDNNPVNNLGDQGGFTHLWTFCFTIRTQTKALCDAGQNDLSIRFMTYSDGESGSLVTSQDCSGDADYVMEAHMECCPKHFAVPFATTCNSTAAGKIQAYGGPVSLFGYDYALYNSDGDLIHTFTGTGTYTSPFLEEGFYNLVTNENTSAPCYTSMITYIPGAMDYNVFQTTYACGSFCLNHAQINMITGNADSVIWNGVPTTSLTGVGLCSGWNYFTIIDTALNCAVDDSVFIVSFPDIDPEFNYQQPTYCTSDGEAIISEFPFLSGGTFSISSGGAGATINASTGTVDLSGASSGPIIIKYATGPPCNKTNFDTILVSISPPPVTAFTDQSFCPGEPHFVFSNTGIDTVLWFVDSALSVQVAAQAPGAGYDPVGGVSTPPGSQFVFYVAASNPGGCLSMPTPVQLNFYDYPSVLASPDVTTCPGFGVQLGVSGANSFNWSPPGLLDDPAAPSPLATPVQTTTFYVTGVDMTSGCSAVDSVTVFVDSTGSCDVVIYNGFTPNGDDMNDYWHIDGISVDKNNNVMIFNRWGDKIWEISGYDNFERSWKGQGAGTGIVPDGTYYYVIRFKDKTLKGYVELTR